MSIFKNIKPFAYAGLSFCMALLFCQCNFSKRPAAKDDLINRYDSFKDDRDGRVYKTVEIGNQTWMAENLDFYVDSSLYYENDSNKYERYGRFYTINKAIAACPKGWHLPTEGDWQSLIKYLGGEKNAGGKMKSLDDWQTPNKGATNESGFSSLPAGYYDISQHTFYHSGVNSTFWCALQKDSADLKYVSIYYDDPAVIIISPYKKYSLNVRCIKDKD